MRRAAGGARGAVSVPTGSLPVAAGLLANGASALVFLALARRDLSAELYSILAVVWVVLFTLGPGVFVPVEQELARQVSSRRALGVAYVDVLRQAVLLVLAVLGLLIALLVGIAGLTKTASWFDKPASMAWLIAAVASVAAASLARGMYAGTGKFGRYGAQLGLDGVLRLVAGAGLLLSKSGDLAMWVAVLAVAQALSVVVTWPRRLYQGPPTVATRASRLTFSVATGALLIATVASQSVANGGVVLTHLDSSYKTADAPGRVLIALIVTRVPLFLYAAVQASLLPKLAHLVAVGDDAGFRRLINSTVSASVGISVVNLIAVAFLGGWMMSHIFAVRPLGRGTLVLLAAGSAVFIVASIGGQGLIARARHQRTAAAWLAALAALGICFASLSSLEVEHRVAVSFLAAASVATMFVAGGLSRSAQVESI